MRRSFAAKAAFVLVLAAAPAAHAIDIADVPINEKTQLFCRDNMGEPYRSGISLRVCKSVDDNGSGVFIQNHEIEQLISALRSLRKMQ